MKKFISIILSIAILVSALAVCVYAQDDGTLNFAVASDLHYVEPTEPIEHNNDDPIYYYANRRAQMEHESGFIIDEFLRQCAENDEVEFVLIPGDLANDGKVVLQQHLDVAEKLCDKVAIIKGGKLLISGTMDEVKGDSSLENVFLELEAEQ